MSKKNRRRFPLFCETLEPRLLLSSSNLNDPDQAEGDPPGRPVPVLVAGDLNGTPGDSSSKRIDPNTLTSPFAGVGSLRITAGRGSYTCTGTPVIDATHVLTAAHCLDINGDGRSDKRDGIRSVTFNLNTQVDLPYDRIDVQIPAASWVTHPDYTGFNRPSINDDLAVITLSTPVPPGTPIYQLYTGSLSGKTIDMVGYGRSGNGVSGFTNSASYTVKRHGQNVIDAFYQQDDTGRRAADEVFRIDFDGPTGDGPLGGRTLGNEVETTLGGGDSGGPSFILDRGKYKIAGVNTYTQGPGGKFGSQAGGMAVPAYADWIEDTVASVNTAFSVSTKRDRNVTGGLKRLKAEQQMTLVPAGFMGSTELAYQQPPTARGSELVSRIELRFSGKAETIVAYAADPPSHVPYAESDGSTEALDSLLERWGMGTEPLDLI